MIYAHLSYHIDFEISLKYHIDLVDINKLSNIVSYRLLKALSAITGVVMAERAFSKRDRYDILRKFQNQYGRTLVPNSRF